MLVGKTVEFPKIHIRLLRIKMGQISADGLTLEECHVAPLVNEQT